MTDYYPLPGDSVSIPNSSTPSTVPLDGGTASGGIVKLTAGEWEKRAQVAADGHSRLAVLAANLSSIGKMNHFGRCTEGESMFGALEPVLAKWASDLATQADRLHQLSEACQAAAAQLTNADTRAEKDLRA